MHEYPEEKFTDEPGSTFHVRIYGYSSDVNHQPIAGDAMFQPTTEKSFDGGRWLQADGSSTVQPCLS